MKYLIVLLIITATIAEIKAGCEKQDDCSPDYCCKMPHLSSSPRCFPKPKKGEPCSVKDEIEYGIYQFTCPCANGFKCRETEDGWNELCD